MSRIEITCYNDKVRRFIEPDGTVTEEPLPLLRFDPDLFKPGVLRHDSTAARIVYDDPPRPSFWRNVWMFLKESW